MQQHVELVWNGKSSSMFSENAYFIKNIFYVCSSCDKTLIILTKVAKITIKTQPWLLDLKFCNQLVTDKLVLEDRL